MVLREEGSVAGDIVTTDDVGVETGVDKNLIVVAGLLVLLSAAASLREEENSEEEEANRRARSRTEVRFSFSWRLSIAPSC